MKYILLSESVLLFISKQSKFNLTSIIAKKDTSFNYYFFV